MRRNTRLSVGNKLIKRIDAKRLHAGLSIEKCCRTCFLSCDFTGYSPLIPVAKRCANRHTVLVEPNIVHRPSVNSDGRYGAMCPFGTHPQAHFHFVDQLLQFPMERISSSDRTIARAMNHVDLRDIVVPLQQGDATALGT